MAPIQRKKEQRLEVDFDEIWRLNLWEQRSARSDTRIPAIRQRKHCQVEHLDSHIAESDQTFETQKNPLETGVTAKMLNFTRRMDELDIPQEWTELIAKLIPKTFSAKELKSHRPVSSLASVRKLCEVRVDETSGN